MQKEATAEWVPADETFAGEDETLRDYLRARPGLILTMIDLAGRYGEADAPAMNDRERTGPRA